MINWRWSLGVALVLAGCASGANECHPGRVNNVFMAASCQMGGGFDAYLAEERSQLEEARRRHVVTSEDLQARRLDMRRLSAQGQELQRRLAAEQGQIDRLSLRLTTLRAETNQEKARKAALQEQLTETQRRHDSVVASAQQYSGADKQEKERLQREIDEQQKEIINRQKILNEKMGPRNE